MDKLKQRCETEIERNFLDCTEAAEYLLSLCELLGATFAPRLERACRVMVRASTVASPNG